MEIVAKHLLLFAATTGYQIRVFAEAARRVGAEVTLATDRCHIMDDPWGDRSLWSRRSHFVVCLAERTRQTTKCDRLPHNGDSGQAPPSLCGDYGIPDSRFRRGGAARGGGSDAGHRPLPHHGRSVGRPQLVEQTIAF